MNMKIIVHICNVLDMLVMMWHWMFPFLCDVFGSKLLDSQGLSTAQVAPGRGGQVREETLKFHDRRLKLWHAPHASLFYIHTLSIQPECFYILKLRSSEPFCPLHWTPSNSLRSPRRSLGEPPVNENSEKIPPMEIVLLLFWNSVDKTALTANRWKRKTCGWTCVF